MENFKVYFQILHPNKAHIPISQHINTCMCLMKSVLTQQWECEKDFGLNFNLIYNHIVKIKKINGGL